MEIERCELTERHRIEYEALGYHLLRDAIEADELRQLREGFDRAEVGGGLKDLPNRDDRFTRLVEHPGFFPEVQRILGDDVQLRSYRGTWFSAEGGRRGWRREVGGMLGVDHPECTLCVRVWIQLDDEDGGGIAVVPGSHRFRTETPFPSIRRIEEMPHCTTLSAGAGSVIIVNDNIWQARIPGETSRRMIELTYTHCWMRQALPELSPHARQVVASSYNLNLLFGDPEDRGGSGHWGFDRELEGLPRSGGLPERLFTPQTNVGKVGEAARQVPVTERRPVGSGL